MSEQSSVINAQSDNNQSNLVEDLNQNVEQKSAPNEVLEISEQIEVNSKNVVEQQPSTEQPENNGTIETKTKPAHQTAELDPAILEKLKQIKAEGKTVTAKVEDRVRGGLKLVFENIPLFLPISHYTLKSNPSEDELIRSVGDILEVEILEINEDVPSHRRNIIVSRKNILEKKFWEEIREGTIVEGTVTSITTFGIFLEVGGFEGLVHISRMSRKRLSSTKNFAKKGDKLKAVVVEVDKAKKRIGLSIADLEPSPWTNVAEKYPVNSIQKVTVKKIVDFGVFVELPDGIEGLIRSNNLSWTQRFDNPKEILQVGQEIDAMVVSVSPDKEMLALSYKHTLHNPWLDIEQKIKINDEVQGIVKQVKPEGVIVTVADEYDGFMPKSKIKNIGKGKKIPFKKGDKVDVIIVDLSPNNQSLILELKQDADALENDNFNRQKNRSNNKQKHDDRPQYHQPIETTSTEVSSFSLSDMIGEDAFNKLFKNN